MTKSAATSAATPPAAATPPVLRIVEPLPGQATRSPAQPPGSGTAGPVAAGWTRRALCTATDPDALFVTGAAQRDAARICGGCPVRLECLGDALDNQIEFGIWGGMTERERRAVLKRSPQVTSWRTVLENARQARTSAAS